MRRHPLASGLIGLAACLFLFLIIPFSQLLHDLAEAPEPISSVPVALPPPPPPLPEPPPPEAEPEPTLPEPDHEPPMPSLDQLEIALNPGTGGQIRVGMGDGFNFAIETVEDLRDLFDFGELDSVPHVVRAGSIEYPPALRRAGTEGFVNLVVIIDQNGGVQVDEVLDYSHRAFVQAAVRGAQNTRFSVPRRNGEPVRARYLWPIRFSLN